MSFELPTLSAVRMSAYASLCCCSLLAALIAASCFVVAVQADEPFYPEGLLDRRFEKANLVNMLTRMLENQQGRYFYDDPLYGGAKRSGALAPGFVGARGKKARVAPGFVGARGKRYWVSAEEMRR